MREAASPASPACLGADFVLRRARQALAASLTPALSRRERELSECDLHMVYNCADLLRLVR